MKVRVHLARLLRSVANRLDNEGLPMGLPIQVGLSYTLTSEPVLASGQHWVRCSGCGQLVNPGHTCWLQSL